MVKSSCTSVDTKREKSWAYNEYYVGERDEEGRRNGFGRNYWTGAKSIEWYTGQLLRDTMHGTGEYRWRYIADEGAHFTYEGHFYCNNMHGYGTMSYPDGRVFTGLFHSNMRWGPGIETHACLREDVGLWRGKQLIRLSWRPATASIAPDLYSTNIGKAVIDSHRVMLNEKHKKIAQTNSALDLIKRYGADPIIAADKWMKMYPNNCTDLASALYCVDAFQHDYYDGKIKFLEEVSSVPEYKEDPSQASIDSNPGLTTYYAWNNNTLTIHMMQHCYTHENQRIPREINLAELLSGSRQQFKAAGQHELYCRSLLMSCYLGHEAHAVKLVNEDNIHPDVADNLGNSALMYASCGDQVDIIQFLVDAGANINSYNDSCCTPLGLALLRYACVQKDISANSMLQAILPPPVVPAPSAIEAKVFEWNLIHDQSTGLAPGGLVRTPSKLSKALPPVKKVKSSQSLKDLQNIRKRTEISPLALPKPPVISEQISDESLTDDKRFYNCINIEFEAKINELFLRPSGTNPVPFLFEVNDIVKEIETSDEEPKKTPEKNPKKVASKVLKETTKPSKEMMWQNTDKDEFSSVDSIEKQKNEMLARIMLTILQLLRNGANPTLVKCPQPALFTAIVSGSPDLVRHLVNSGANINETYNGTFGYTPLDLAVSREFTSNTLELVRAILECGANTSHRLRYEDYIASSNTVLPKDYGPSLLHAVLARKTEYEIEDEIKRNFLALLLEYNCNPLIQFKGRSAIDVAMSKNMDLLNVFIKSPTTNLNASINDLNQTALVKMFTLPFFKTVLPLERLQILTNLLLYGADPLIACKNGAEEYQNIFVFALKTLTELEAGQAKAHPASPPGKGDLKKTTPPAPKKEQLSTKSVGKLGADDVGDYKQAIDLVTECARLLHVRWLQAKLMKELVDIVDRFKHRQWNMIMKEHKRKKATGLWLTTQRCLEMWDILKLTKKKVYSDNRVVKNLLYIVQFYSSLNKISSSSYPTTDQKNSVECNISYLLKERAAANLTNEISTSWKRPYVKPELTFKSGEHKFNVCFECALPFKDEKIRCVSCKLVGFCSFDCMKVNIERTNCHPCSGYLKRKYFPSPTESGTQDLFSSV